MIESADDSVASDGYDHVYNYKVKSEPFLCYIDLSFIVLYL